MKYLNIYSKKILLLFLLIMPFYLSAAQYACPGENVQNINGATGDANKKYVLHNNTSNKGPDDYARYWKFETDVNGSITITQTLNKDVNGYYNHDLLISDSACNDHNIFNSVQKKNTAHTFDVYAGKTYYVKIKEHNSKNQLNVDIEFDFTKQDIIQYPCSNPHAFITRFNEYIPGDLIAIGNSNVCADVEISNAQNKGNGICDDNQKQRNDKVNIIHNNKFSVNPNEAWYTDIHNQPDTLFNVSNATLELPSNAKVVWAGLFWHGEVWNFWERQADLTNSAGVDSGADGKALMALENTIQFKSPITNYEPITAEEHYWVNLKRAQGSSKNYGYGYGTDFGYNTNHAFNFSNKTRYEHHYQGFKNVTTELQAVESANGTANGIYWVGNIQATVGNLWYPGVEAAWTLQVVYTLDTAQPRVITITDGYVALYNAANQGRDYADANNCPNDSISTGVYGTTIDFDINNILTPKKDHFATDMTVFVTESDPEDSSTTEWLKITKKDNTKYLVDGNNAWNYEIKDKNGHEITRQPGKEEYPIGVTIKNYHMTDALSQDQNSTHVYFSTDSDKLIIGVIGFATDLVAPELCYGYDIRVGDRIKIDSEDRNFSTRKWGNEDLQIKMFIRSMTADFDFENAKLKVDFTPAPNTTNSFTYKGENTSLISPSNINTYIPAIDIPPKDGQIAIGHDTSIVGGTIESNESTYVKQFFEFTGGDFEGKFDIQIEGNVTYTPTLTIHYDLSTAIPEGVEGHIPLCPTNLTYDPIWGQFNVENTFGTNGLNSRLPLLTQVTGRKYEVNLASYTRDTNGEYTSPTASNAIVEVELIDASSYDNNASTGYDSTCQEPTAEGKGIFVDFNGQDKATLTLDPTVHPDYDDKIALQSAAFRIWVLTKKDENDDNIRVVVNHECASADAKLTNGTMCFDKVYENEYKNQDDNETKYCEDACDNSTGTTCYDCLRDYFATPTCSRDNFSIRPDALKVKIYDTNETDGTGLYTPKILNGNYTDVSPKKKNIAAGYKYQLIAEAMMYQDGTARSTSYYKYFEPLDAADINPLPANMKTDGSGAILKFDTTTGSCFDSNNTSHAITIKDSDTLEKNATFIHRNVGKYQFWMSDADWTKVDQADYEYKTTFPKGSTPQNDCTPNDASSSDMVTNTESLVGCTLSSSIASSDYEDIELIFHPYNFYTNIGIASVPENLYNSKWNLFMNDFSNSYYDDILPHPITMGVILDGNITAVGKDSNAALTNFTQSCAASNLIIELRRISNPVEDSSNIILQRYLQYNFSSPAISEKIENKDSNNTLLQAAFPDITYPGIGSMKLYTTFKKKNNTPLNPIEIQYHSLVSYGILEGSYVDYDNSTKHIPSGESIYDKNATFMYAKITPAQSLYNNIEEDTVQTPIFIDVYCSTGSSDCNNTYGLSAGTHGIPADGNWYNAILFDKNGIGTTDLSVSTSEGGDANPTVSTDLQSAAQSISDVAFNNPAKKEEINIKVNGAARPTTVKVNYSPLPWLILDPAKDYYRVRFIGPSSWAGVGNPGHVSDAESSHESTPRMNW